MSMTFRLSNGDFSFDESGRLQTLSGVDKLNQDVAYELLTKFSASDNVGNELLDTVGQTSVQSNVNDGYVEACIRAVVERLKERQQADEYASASEKIRRIRSLVVRRLSMTSYGFFLILETEAGTTASLPAKLNLNHQGLPADFADVLLGGST